MITPRCPGPRPVGSQTCCIPPPADRPGRDIWWRARRPARVRLDWLSGAWKRLAALASALLVEPVSRVHRLDLGLADGFADRHPGLVWDVLGEPVEALQSGVVTIGLGSASMRRTARTRRSSRRSGASSRGPSPSRPFIDRAQRVSARAVVPPREVASRGEDRKGRAAGALEERLWRRRRRRAGSGSRRGRASCCNRARAEVSSGSSAQVEQLEVGQLSKEPRRDLYRPGSEPAYRAEPLHVRLRKGRVLQPQAAAVTPDRR